jgi:hypothetical protein
MGWLGEYHHLSALAEFAKSLGSRHPNIIRMTLYLWLISLAEVASTLMVGML